MARDGEQIDVDRIADLTRKIAYDSDRGTPPGDYFQQLLRLIQQTLDYRSAAAWGLDQRGVLAKIAEISAGGNTADATAVRARTKRLLDALISSGPTVYAAEVRSLMGSADDITVLVPFYEETRPRGVLEVMIAASSPPAGIERATAIVTEFAGYASRYVTSHAVHSGNRGGADFGLRFNQIVLELHRELSVDHVSLTAVNEGRTLLGFDRLSLAAARGKQTKILAVSGQERIVARSNLVRAMTDLAAKLLSAGKPFRTEGDLDILPPQLREPLLEYMKESGAGCIEAIPLQKQFPSDGTEEGAPGADICGLLLGEHFQQPKTALDSDLAQAFADHVAVALTNARELESHSTGLRRFVRQHFGPSEIRSARQAAAVIGSALAALLVVGMAPVTHRVEALGRLMPIRRSELFAPLDGRVKEVLVDSNQVVAKGQVLLRLDNERLASELLTTRHRLQEQQQILATLEAQSARMRGERQDRESIRLDGAISQARVEISSIKSQLESLKEESQELEVLAPISGVVTTFDPQRILLNRPVQRGERLLEVMDTRGPWELELDLPAKSLGHVLRAQSAAGSAPVPVQFTLATAPEKSFNGSLRNVSSRIVASAEAVSVAPLEVNVAVREIAHPVAGVDVVARINCGKQPLCRAVFGDVLDFVRRRVW